MKRTFVIFLIVCLLPALIAKQGMAQDVAGNYLNSPENSVPDIIDNIIETSKQYLGKPYRFLNERGQKMDCSGFLSYIFSLYNVSLPRSATAIALKTIKINFEDIRKGDLLFFKGRNAASPRVGHVSMVIEKDDEHLKMIHSCRRGVIIDEYPMIYYRERFLFPGKVAGLYKTCANGDTIPLQGQKPAGVQLPDTVIRKASADTLTRKEYPGIISREVSPDTILQKTVADTTLHKVTADTLLTAGRILKDTLTVIGVGDIMLGTDYPSKKYLPPNDGKDLLTPVKDILQDADITFGNLEGALLTGTGQPKRCRDTAHCYTFKSPEHYVNYLKEAGFDIVNLANNHSGDFGASGRKNTMRVLKEADIYFAGLTEYPYEIFTVDSITYGFCGFAPNSGTLNINNPSLLQKTVSHLDSIADIVIVSFHGGAEGAEHRHITRKNETFIGENRGNPYLFARTAIDAGADIVFGHGPHVTRAVDLYKNRFIAYSLGNFATYDRFNLVGPGGMAPIIKVSVNRKGEFLGAKITSIRQVGEGGPVIDKNNGALKEIINLTKTDIPESELSISPTGEVTRKPSGVNNEKTESRNP